MKDRPVVSEKEFSRKALAAFYRSTGDLCCVFCAVVRLSIVSENNELVEEDET